MSIILGVLGISNVEPTCNLIYHFFPGPPKYHLLLAPCPAKPHPTDQRSHLSLEKQKSLNINIASYFLETLASLNGKTWHERGGPISQTINQFSLNPNHQRSVEDT